MSESRTCISAGERMASHLRYQRLSNSRLHDRWGGGEPLEDRCAYGLCTVRTDRFVYRYFINMLHSRSKAIIVIMIIIIPSLLIHFRKRTSQLKCNVQYCSPSKTTSHRWQVLSAYWTLQPIPHPPFQTRAVEDMPAGRHHVFPALKDHRRGFAYVLAGASLACSCIYTS